MNTQITSEAITFDSLLEKYDGHIARATSEELQRVRPNGLKELFAANRRYRAKVGQVQRPVTGGSFFRNLIALVKTKTHLRKQVR